ncbi:MAG TPA: Gfo/Idh/MocA family oxidoreductase [Candidatus Sulfotelmatobacter sp.]|nr:Gfo/Idh/MocA family oxidoreductase [Candidatus Sulfotelmatobacter sp.]
MAKNPLSRRQFMQIGSGALAATTVAKTILQPHLLSAATRVAPSDTVRFASIGTGVRGCELLEATTHVPGVECVGVCDLYDTRHTAAREAVGKPTVTATREYRAILDRKDIDAVIIAVTDHQHRHIFEDACAAGKDVYCEKPMSHTVEDGFSMVETAHKNNRIIQIGSQRVSSVLYAKAKEIYDSGKLGEVFSINAYWDRNSPSGAWVYPIPPDASEKTIDWNTFLGDAPKHPFDPVRFFRWRCFKDYGEGLAGDLFVHLISGIHFITGANTVAQRAQSSGGLYHFKDGREFPDLIETLYDYPNFKVTLRCNLNNDGGEFIGFYGTQGTMIIKDTTLTYKPQDTRPEPEGYSVFGWPKELREQYLEEWHKEHPKPAALASKLDAEGESYANPPGYSDTVDHQANFFHAVRSRKPVTENEIFGNHAAIGCHLSNFAYFNQSVAVWDPAAKKIVKG